MGRRNQYTINRDSMFRHSAQDGQTVGPFLELLTGSDESAPGQLR